MTSQCMYFQGLPMISEAKEALEERQAAVKLKGKIADTEWLLDFLLQLQRQK